MTGLLAVLSAAGFSLPSPVSVDGRGNAALYCPWHQEGPGSKPSLSFHVHRGVWHCYACQERGGLRRLLGVAPAPLTEAALREVLAGVDQEERPIQPPVYGQHGYTLASLPETLLTAFESIRTPEKAAALGLGRFSSTTLRAFEVGYDRSRRRVVYPIRADTGELLGISGRAIDKGASGYKGGRYRVYTREIGDILNPSGIPYPQAALSFSNHAWVWGLHRVRNSANPLVIAEGFKAAMFWTQYGWEAVALMGTDMSHAQYGLLLSYATTRTCYLALDNDPPGKMGADRILRERTGLRLLRVPYPDGVKQVDELPGTAESVRDALHEMIHTATPW